KRDTPNGFRKWGFRQRFLKFLLLILSRVIELTIDMH
ncbi:hypothetical protein HKBW3S34_02497, partial [Candidatus Hakubella thermalkaliphila]